MYFDELPLNEQILDALDDMNFSKCTPIQEHAIPKLLDGRDLIGIAQTGTGKTAAFLLPILHKLNTGTFPPDTVKCIIMSPTRELVQQTDQALQGFSYYLNISSLAIYGGNDGIRYEQEKRSLSTGADIIIATPGRLISHISLGNADLSHVAFFVLDEADRMLDMGFYDDIMQIVNHIPTKRQTIMFSATMPHKIQELAHTVLNNPVEIKLAVTRPADKIKQSACLCHEAQKMTVIKQIFAANTPKRVLIFASSKMKVKDLAISLHRAGFNACAMHSDLEQKERDKVILRFKAHQIEVLVATDILSRGIDIDDISMVINYDVPHDAEDYVHRVGRTARADNDGEAVTLVNEKDKQKFLSIERRLHLKVERIPAPGTPETKASDKRPRPEKSDKKNKPHNKGGKKAPTLQPHGKKPAHRKKPANKTPQN